MSTVQGPPGDPGAMFGPSIAPHIEIGFTIAFFRSLFVFIPILFMVSRNGGIGSLRVNNWGGQVLRGGCVLFTTFGFVMAIKVMLST